MSKNSKSKVSKVISDDDVSSVSNVSSVSVSTSKSSKPVYVSMDQRTHILHRPDMYIGSIKNTEVEFYGAYVDNVYNEEKDKNIEDEKSPKKLVKDDSYKPNMDTLYIYKKTGLINFGLHRIFIEVLSNAIDNVWRSLNTETKSTKIKVDINEDGRITVWNDGMSIPVEINKESGIYNPELIFGKLLTSSNYDDNEERMTSGRNGLGSKATCVFSKEFNVKLFDPITGHQYIQTWKDNMSQKTEPKITSPKQKNGYTQISFLPDYEKFGVNSLSDDMKSLFFKNIVDTAMITGISVYYNDQKVPVKTMKDYASLYYKDETDMIFIESPDSKVVLASNKKPEGFSQISFVNGIETFHGGVHVDSWSNSLLKPILDKLNSTIKKGNNLLTFRDIRPYFKLFLNCNLVNPSFTSQEKSYLGSPNVLNPSEHIQQKHINTILKWDVIQNIKEMVKGKELNELKKTEKKKGFKKIVGLDQANLAGSKYSDQCSLILCEGDSAKTFAVKGIQTGIGSKKGRDYFGIYPLRGKCLNVRNSNVSTIANNQEICDVIQTLNLKYGVDYKDDKNYETLCYGRVIILTDSDVDGYHICGLLLNFFHKLFPTLLERNPSFITCMRTPIVRIYYPKSDVSFYTLEDFKKYQTQNPNKKGEVKYFKGLGTNNNKEIETCFGKKMIEFVKDEKTDLTMDKVFNSKYSDQRKKWLEEYNPLESDEIVGKGVVQELGISEFLDKEMIKFSIDDCKRSIPSIMDGFKESHRKIIYATFLKNLKNSGKTMKVAQLAGFVAEKTNYHHGEQCLFDTITKLAHDFVGSNNIPYLYRDGQFGGRIAGGKDAANARYIFTKLDCLTRLIFREEDEVLLDYIYDDGDKVEPHFFVPILPTILVNGCMAGIGTGWSSQVPCYNPLDLIQWIRTWLNNEEQKEDDIIPWYRGFNGTIEKISKNKYITKGIIERKTVRGVNKVIVKELPVYLWIDKFKDHLDTLLENKNIKSYKNYSSDVEINFEIDELKESEFECNEETLKLTTTISSNNMVMFSKEGQLKKYDDISTIMEEFCEVRSEFYKKRKEYILQDFKNKLLILTNKMKFLKEVMDGDLIIQDIDEDDLCKEMKKRGYYYMNDTKDEEESKLSGYSYLINMNIRSFTKQKLESLQKEIDSIKEKVKDIENTTEKKMWLDDLKELEVEYKKLYKL
jgi:DNA topoisomerase-2